MRTALRFAFLAAVVVSAVNGDDVSSALIVVTLLVFGLGYGVASPSIPTARASCPGSKPRSKR